MKSLVYAVIAASVIAAPIASFAQSSQQPVTRAEVRADLVKVEQAGYNPNRDNITYPADIQAAEARVNAQQGTAVASVADTSGYGGSNGGAVQSGIAKPMNVDGVHPLYFGR
ncbi:DUF4148 domain-containing protein [Trinickia terrae]|uniref:DUF4148 domain-containing protein n=1 Tax=Trinickia terrae TaxID=2571161 RepID=A0A4U1IFB5_9BURK|nr:DUF4148 domain-containing protein [Trinickia terrae]TKC92361.1 DUF4148 domain-containing protein [Trinickia terrae]